MGGWGETVRETIPSGAVALGRATYGTLFSRVRNRPAVFRRLSPHAPEPFVSRTLFLLRRNEYPAYASVFVAFFRPHFALNAARQPSKAFVHKSVAGYIVVPADVSPVVT